MSRKELYLKSFHICIILVAAITAAHTFRSFYQIASTLDGIKRADGRVFGGDFIAFYLAGRDVASTGQPTYDYDKQLKSQRLFQKENGVAEFFLPFIYPPLTALPFTALSKLPFIDAYYFWTTLSFLLLASSLAILSKAWRLRANQFFYFSLLSLAFIPFTIGCIGGGQTSCFGLLIFTLTAACLKLRRDFLGGLILSLSYYKPPIFLTLVLALILSRNKNLFLGFAIGACALLLGSVSMVGVDGLMDYINLALGYRYGENISASLSLPPEKGVGLLSLLTTLHSENHSLLQILVLLLTLLVVVSTAGYSRQEINVDAERGVRFDLLFCALAFASLLFSIQMVVYDLTIALLPLAVLANYFWDKKYSLEKVLAITATFTLYFDPVIRNFNALGVPLKSAPLAMGVLLWISLRLLARESDISSNN